MRIGYLSVLLPVLLLAACSQGPDSARQSPTDAAHSSAAVAQAHPIDHRWLAHLSAWPHGQISARAPLIVQFSHPVVAQSEVDKPANAVVRVQPMLPLTMQFTARDRLEIRPEQAWPRGQTLTLTLYAQKLAGIDDGLPPLVLPLTVMPQSLQVRVDSLAPADDDTMILAGQVQTGDIADPAKVAQTVRATQNGRALKITWQHDSSGHRHSFTVTGIHRDAQAAAVSLTWTGKPLGVDAHGGHDYPVPASAQDFAITMVRTVAEPEPHLRVQFSQPLLDGQDLAGLVTLDGKPAKVRIDGSALDVYPKEKIEHSKVILEVNPGVLSATKLRLTTELKRELILTLFKPGVRFVGTGSILPAGKTLSVPFEAVQAKSVKVQAFEVFADNIPQYLQDHALDSGVIDSDTGRWLWQKTLSLPPAADSDWQRYRLDLTELMAKHPHGLVLLALKLDTADSTYPCSGKQPTYTTRLPDSYEGPNQERSYTDAFYEDRGYLRWDERDDPCSNSYFANNDSASATRAFLASNLGLIAKQGEGHRLLVFASQLDHNTPAAGVTVSVYNYQHQRIGQGVTDAKGELSVTVDGTPFDLVASRDQQRGYLKLASNLALPSNQFDTSGVRVSGGLKGFFYGERDVWRPGDDIHLTFVLGDPDQHLPANYPVTLDWIDPRGNKLASTTNSKPVGAFYAFTLKTADSAPTGNWQAVARLGKRSFSTHVRVEAIKPNHLKIDLDAPAKLMADSDNPITLHGQWLNGATASNLKSDVKVRLLDRNASFPGYAGFEFNDPTRTLGAKPFTAFEGSLDAKGRVHFKLSIPEIEPPGMATAVLTTRVFEASGDYSTQIRALPVMPYQHWVGLHVPKGTGWGDALSRDKDNEIGLLTLDSDGKPEANRHLTLSVYEVDWRWWWDRDEDNALANYVSDPDTQRLKKTALITDSHGRAQWTLHGPDYDWGRYLIRVCQDDGKQCAAQTVYLGWGGDRSAGGDAATRLALSSDKPRYRVGDTAHVKVPASPGGRLLVSLETGSKVLRHYWVTVPPGQDSQLLDIPVTAAMAPNVYVDVMLLQAHAERDNDRPIRLYGIVPLLVDDPGTRLQPVIEAPASVRPEHPLTVRVSEHGGQPMTYTLAVVDEGLLGLTNFQTPHIHDAFYQREALGVRTWDLYDQVVGAYGGDLARLLALGGSDALANGRERQSRRFPPVVRFLGPFQLAKGQTQTHHLTLPAYMGEVRIMVVAGNLRAYGQAERDVTVTQPLTVLSTLPRVLGPEETVDLPVTVFAAPGKDGKVPSTVTLAAKAHAPLTVTRGTATLHFDQAGNQIGLLSLKVGKAIGTADVTVTADAGPHHAEETIHMPIRSANPATTDHQGRLLDKGKSWSATVQPHGVKGTNQAWLVVSRLPDMGLQRRLDYLIHYPHGCIEQTTSSVFPQLYLGQLIALDDIHKQRIQANVDAAIARLQRFQVAGGGFSYWPDGSVASDWGTNYAGHFLLEAKRLGYAVPADLLESWQRYQQRQANSLGDHPWNWSIQAYRLYDLTLAGAPDIGAMNRLRALLMGEAGRQERDPDADYLASRWLLAGAYQQMGLKDIATALVPNQVSARYGQSWYHTYGSQLRDQAIALLVRNARGNTQGTWSLAKQIAGELASSDWYSTQSVSWALLAMAHVVGAGNPGQKGFDFRWQQDKEIWRPIHSQSAVFRQALENPDQARAITVENRSDKPLFVSVTTRGTPAPGEETAAQHGLAIKVRFEDMTGRPINPGKLRQGTDLQAFVTVTNRSDQALQHVALTQIMPSGWQITESARAGDTQKADLNYRDVRDDRVLTYFSLPSGESRTYSVGLNASFAGHFYLPAWQAEAMYKGDVQGRSAGRWVDVEPD